MEIYIIIQHVTRCKKFLAAVRLVPNHGLRWWAAQLSRVHSLRA